MAPAIQRVPLAAPSGDNRAAAYAEGQGSPTLPPTILNENHPKKPSLAKKHFVRHTQDVERSRTASPSSEAEAAGQSSAEEELVTAGAKATLSNTSRWVSHQYRNKGLKERELAQDSDKELESEQGSEEASEPDIERVQHRQPGFPDPEDLPSWFPKNIERIYKVDRHGGALKFEELNEITRYRSALERIYRRKWQMYISAGNARWRLQRMIRKLRVRPLTKAFLNHRTKQYKHWKEQALKAWKTLEKTHLGIRVLDETIDINFRQERIIYRKDLGRKL